VNGNCNSVELLLIPSLLRLLEHYDREDSDEETDGKASEYKDPRIPETSTSYDWNEVDRAVPIGESCTIELVGCHGENPEPITRNSEKYQPHDPWCWIWPMIVVPIERVIRGRNFPGRALK
jgi:hypothetical protein